MSLLSYFVLTILFCPHYHILSSLSYLCPYYHSFYSLWYLLLTIISLIKIIPLLKIIFCPHYHIWSSLSCPHNQILFLLILTLQPYIVLTFTCCFLVSLLISCTHNHILPSYISRSLTFCPMPLICFPKYTYHTPSGLTCFPSWVIHFCNKSRVTQWCSLIITNSSPDPQCNFPLWLLGI